jgi:hypothetical protein
MKTNGLPRSTWLATLIALLTTLIWPALAQNPTVAERVTMLKNTIAASKEALRQYEWVESTVVTVGGKENWRKQERCTYGADGRLAKVVLNQTSATEKKQEDLKLYMDKAISLVRAYLPLDPDRILLAKNTDNVMLQPTERGKRARVIFRNYIASDDRLALEVDLSNNRPVAGNVATHFDSAKDTVTVAAKFATLPDGTVYVSEAVLQAKKKKLTVNVQNSGHKKVSP